MKRLNEQWTADIVGTLHYLNSTHTEFAYYMGITPQYLSSILNGKKIFESDYAKNACRKRIETALKSYKEEIESGRTMPRILWIFG